MWRHGSLSKGFRLWRNGIFSIRRQVIIWANAGLLLTGPLGTNFNAVWIKIQPWTNRGRETQVSKLTTIDSDNGLASGRRQVIIWTNAGKWLIGPLGINFSEILIEIITFSFKKTHLKMWSTKWRLFHLGHNELTYLKSNLIMSALMC